MSNTAEKPIILIADHIADNIENLDDLLSEKYLVKAANTADHILNIVNDVLPTLILLDVTLNDHDGTTIIDLLKDDRRTEDIPVILMGPSSSPKTAERALKAGAFDFIPKPINPEMLKMRVDAHIALHQHNKGLAAEVEKRTHELYESRLQVIRHLGRAAEFRDNETGMHVIRMSQTSRLIASVTNNNDAWVNNVYLSAPMHDIGKIGIRDSVLLKPGKFDEMERTEMNRHTIIGAEIIGEHDTDLMRMARQVALYHHERWDGEGYPERLSEEEIPLSARIVAIADVFDALTSKRPYKEPWSIKRAVEHIQGGAGTQFDPKLVDLFRMKLPEIKEAQRKYSD